MTRGQNNTEQVPNIVDFFGIGKENAITQRELCKKLGCTPDQVKAAVQRFRRTNTNQSSFICSDGNGYYIAKNMDEIKHFVSITSKQAISRFETMKEARRMLKDVEGQGHIDGSGEHDDGFQG